MLFLSRFVCFLLTFSYISAETRIVCYYTNWSVYRQTTIPILYPDKIDPSLCTHIHVAFASINTQTLRIEPSEKHDTHYTDAFHMPLYLRLYELKQRKPSLRILIAVGGWTAKSDGFNQILTNSSTRMIFIQNTKEFLFEWNFDGIDLDWEFPGDSERGARNDSREQFNILIKEMHDSFHNEKNPYLLTAAVTANPTKVDLGYVVPDFCQYLDYVSVMSYDYFGAWDNVTGINAPLYEQDSVNIDNDEGRWKNVNYSIHYWMSKGCSASKLNLGLASYGRSFTLTNDSTSVSIGTESIGAGLAGPYTKEEGTLAYFEICKKLRTTNWTNVFDTNAQAPYAYSTDRQWVGYDDLKSITVKVWHAKSLELGGVMIWSLDQDDYTGLFCGQGLFPITRHVHDILLSSSDNKYHEEESTSSTKRVNIRTTQRSTSTKSSSKTKNMAKNLMNNNIIFLLSFVFIVTKNK